MFSKRIRHYADMAMSCMQLLRRSHRDSQNIPRDMHTRKLIDHRGSRPYMYRRFGNVERLGTDLCTHKIHQHIERYSYTRNNSYVINHVTNTTIENFIKRTVNEREVVILTCNKILLLASIYTLHYFYMVMVSSLEMLKRSEEKIKFLN